MRNNKTLLGKLGFDDNDSKTPKHDEILNLIIKNSVISKIANVLKYEYKDEDGIFKRIVFNDNDNWEKYEEFILKTKSNFVVGAIDLCVRLTKAEFEFPTFFGDGNNFMGTGERCQINIEIKGEINSVGQLIRQINVYREFISGPFVVIAPYIEESYRNRLKEANIFPISMDELGLPTVWCEQFTEKGFDGHFISNIDDFNEKKK